MTSLDKIDNKILTLIGKTPLHPSEIARKLALPRTSVNYRLNKLKRVKLAESNIKGRLSIWRPIYKNTHNKNLYRLYKGAEIIEAYEHLLNLPRHTSVLCVQGSTAAKSQLNQLPPLFIKKAHQTFRRKQIIMRGILNEKCLNLFNDLNQDMIQSHIGRTQGLKIVAGDRFLDPGEIMSTEKFLMLSNPSTKTALVIKDKGITKIVNDTLKIIFNLLDNHKSFDLNNYLSLKTKEPRS